jgi:integrase
MAKVVGKLTALSLSKPRGQGHYHDGNGLYFQVARGGSQSWVYRYMLNKRPRMMGLGSYPELSLGDARKRAAECRRLRNDGIDPIETQKAVRTAAKVEAAKGITFENCSKAYIESHKNGWRNAKHAEQWTTTLSTYAYPVFGDLPVDSVDTKLVMKVLEPIWAIKTETAARLRGRIENILDWAKTREYREGENPARWRGHLQNLLPQRRKVRKVRHHPALPYDKMPSFMKALRKQKGTVALAFEFLILTAARTSEAIGARWDEIDLAKAVWTVPSTRIKAGREHRVPLSGPAIALLRKLAKVRHGEFVFAGAKKGKPLSNMALLALLKRMERTKITAHGFRSTFRDWAAELNEAPGDVAEMALAHVVGDKVEAAYRRGDLVEKRKKLMQEWATYCG